MGGSPAVNLEATQNVVTGNGRKLNLLKDWDGWITGCEPGGNTEHCRWFLKGTNRLLTVFHGRRGGG